MGEVFWNIQNKYFQKLLMTAFRRSSSKYFFCKIRSDDGLLYWDIYYYVTIFLLLLLLLPYLFLVKMSNIITVIN